MERKLKDKEMIMAQNEYDKIIKAMADKGVPHWAFELLCDLRSNEVNNSLSIDALKASICDALKPHLCYENLAVHHGNYLQVIRKLKDRYMSALDEIAESHSSRDVEVDGTICFDVDCGCEFCIEWRRLRDEMG